MAFLRSSISMLAGAALLAASSVQGQTILGGWSSQNATSDDIEVLVDAASNVTTYGDDVTTRICLIAVESLKTQTVAGTNYDFQVAGCTVDSDDELGACDDRNCDYSSYDIIIYSQPWTDTLEVKSITLVE